MSYRVWMAVLAVALANVIFGLGWQYTDTTPTPAAVPAAPPVVNRLRAPAPVAAPAVERVTSGAAPAVPAPEDDGSQASAAQASEEPAAPPLCNIRACEAAYRSFRASDCTYQPYDGPRRLCAKK